MTDLEVVFCRGRRHFQELHEPVQEAVDDLKAGALVVVEGAEAPLVLGPDILGDILQDDVGDLEEPQGERHLAVGLGRLQQTRQQRRSGNLENRESRGDAPYSNIVTLCANTGFLVYFAPNSGRNFGPTQPNFALTQGN